MRLDVQRRELKFREPVRTAFGELERREILEVVVRDREAITGRGEAAPLEPYDGVSIEAAEEALEACREPLAAADGTSREHVLAGCAERCTLPQALAAVDLALWDLAGRRAGRPVAALLGETPARAVSVNATVGSADRSGAAERAAAAAAGGFGCVKLKVGIGDDAGRVAAVRAAVGPDVAIRLDANGAWSVEQAAATLRALTAADIELCEEPVSGIAAFRELHGILAGEVAIAMDETASRPGALDSGAADLVCLKLASCGGITGLLRAAGAARDAGSEVYVASTFDGPAGIAAGLHAAAALSPLRHCGLATLALFDGIDDPWPPRGGLIAVPSGPGLGL